MNTVQINEMAGGGPKSEEREGNVLPLFFLAAK